ncbi:MAG: ATP-binding cassette domain-containing protein [Planctomycetia bacterium]|nr:ATP-binding cassette domain-containing protein [Planctomycetia bacterium]
MTDAPAVELRNVSKVFGDVKAVDDVTLQIPKGRVVALLGPSGCGKSTLLRLMIGVIQPDAGGVCFEGTRLTTANALALRRRMGYVIQDGGLFPHLTARGNATLVARYLGWTHERVEARLAELTELTQFPREGLDRYPVQLSGGQQQRVALMRALMLDPDVLLMDEPLGALDPIIRRDLQTELRRIFEALRKTVVLVTHEIGEAGFFSDVIVLLRQGRIVQRGKLDELVRSPADPFVARFINAQRSPLEALGGSVP